jgi:Uma2 family endonuclease
MVTNTSQFQELISSAAMVGLTLDQYIRMIDAGILPEGEPVELLDGFLVRKDRSKAGEYPKTVGFDHIWAVQNLVRVLDDVQSHDCHLSLQQPLGLSPASAPEPDGAIIRGTLDDYRARYPSAVDAPCVIEVSDSSLQFDRVTKRRIYSEAGIEQYVLINLVDRLVEVFSSPVVGGGRYRDEAILRPGDVVRFSTGGGRAIELEVAALLP